MSDANAHETNKLVIATLAAAIIARENPPPSASRAVGIYEAVAEEMCRQLHGFSPPARRESDRR